jgi:hypothetical protein
MFFYVTTIAGLLYLWKRDPEFLDRTINKVLWTSSIVYAKTLSSSWFHKLRSGFKPERELTRTTSRIHPPVFDFSTDELLKEQ